MKLPLPVSGSVAVLVFFAASGCATSEMANGKENRDDALRMAAKAKGYENSDGSLDPAYLVDVLLNGNGRKKAAPPVFDQPKVNGTVP